jgi:quinol monooxygenase YgiN
MRHGSIGSMKVKPGHRAEVTAVLVAGAEGLREAGCELYLVTESAADEDTIWVTEVWQSREHHDASLQLPEVGAAVDKVMPLLTGEFTQQQTRVVGGLGI